MREEKESIFREVERFLLNLALLMMLLIGLWRVIAPEVREVLYDLKDERRPTAVETRESDAEKATEPAGIFGGH